MKKKTLSLIAVILFLFSFAKPVDNYPVFDIPLVEETVIDGDISDWEGKALKINGLTSKKGITLPVDDFKADMQLAWSKDGLLVGLIVTDDIRKVNPSIGTGDSFEIFLADKKGAGEFFQLFISPISSEDFPEVRTRFNYYGEKYKDREMKVTAVQKDIKNGYIMEVLLPWENLSINSELGNEIGFQIFVKDKDEEKDLFTSVWYPSGLVWVETTKMHSIRLAQKASKEKTKYVMDEIKPSEIKFHTDFRYGSTVDDFGKPKETLPERIYGPIFQLAPFSAASTFLIETKEGLIMIDTNYPDNAPILAENIKKLGFDIKDLKIILNTHRHWDHIGSNAYLKELSGAQVMVHEDFADIIETGGRNIAPCKVDRRLKDHEKITFGEVTLELLPTPGHCYGHTSFITTVNGPDGSCVAFFQGDALQFKNTVPSFKSNCYPGVVEDYKKTIGFFKQLEFDLWVGGHPHGVSVHMREDGYPFVSRDMWLKYINNGYSRMEKFLKDYPDYEKYIKEKM